ncbi:MAG: glycosyltransferase family 4 protein [Pseudomonadota bacterium]
MKLLFVHQNMPGQYREMMAWLLDQNARGAKHELVFLTQRRSYPAPEGVTKILYQPHHAPADKAYGLSKVWEEAAGTGFGAVYALATHEKATGFRPDLVIGHTGWGEMLFLKELWPDVPVLGFFEYFYRSQGAAVGFDPEEPVNAHTPYILNARNSVPHANLHVVDRLTAPTRWQADLFPALYRQNMYVCHDGIRTDHLRPDPDVSLSLGRLGRPITRADEVFTYVARNMERMRGFHIFMRALPRILKARPNARALIIGGNETSYGPKAKMEGGFRAELEKEVGAEVDWTRVHFLGQIPYPYFQKVVQISKCHIYLTKPFVLSWSLLEAMSMEAPIVASDVAPVREAVTHGETGLLVDFFQPEDLADQVVDVLARPDSYAAMRRAAREHVVATYDFETICLPQHIAEMNALVPASAGHIAI